MKLSKRFFSLAVVILVVMAFVPVVPADEAARIDLNKASIEELMQVKGIGQKYAERIIESREENGPFASTEGIMKIKGIGAKKFEKIKELITISERK